MRLRRNKYGVSPKADRTVDGIVFDSKKECRRYGELKLLQKAGEITNLEIQPRFDIHIKKTYIAFYKADFRYLNRDGTWTVEDCKGLKMPIYRLKKKLVEALHGIEITET